MKLLLYFGAISRLLLPVLVSKCLNMSKVPAIKLDPCER